MFPMIVLHAFHSYYPSLGGMERAIQGLAETQATLGHEIHVITSTYGAQQRSAEETINDVHIHRIKAWRFHYPDLTIPRIMPVEMLRKADIVHVHGHNSLFSMKMLNEAFRLGVKTACYFMAVDAFRDHPNMFIRLLSPYYGRWNTKRALKTVNLPLVKSIRDLEILREKYSVDAEYLPDAIPDYYFTAEKADPDEFREKFGIKQEKIFLFIGRMHKLKGPHILVKALKYVGKDTAAVFIGPDGGYLKETLDLAERIGVKDRVYMLGYVDEEIKIKALDSAIALVLPSLADYVEVYPMVISEAWARERPVIASMVGGIPYRIKQDVNGVLVDPSDPKMLAEAMLKLAHDKELAEEMGRNGRKDVFSWREIAVKSIQLYRRVLENR
jgi:glycosyltransferase involved in cell wall biosynthesis